MKRACEMNAVRNDSETMKHSDQVWSTPLFDTMLWKTCDNGVQKYVYLVPVMSCCCYDTSNFKWRLLLLDHFAYISVLSLSRLNHILVGPRSLIPGSSVEKDVMRLSVLSMTCAYGITRALRRSDISSEGWARLPDANGKVAELLLLL